MNERRLPGGASPHTLVRDARLAAGLTQAELAERLDSSQPAVAKLERPGANPTVNTLDRVLMATGHRLQLIAPSWGDFDLSLLRGALRLTPARRIAAAVDLYREARELYRAAARSRGELA